MDGFGVATYGDRIAEVYDQLYPGRDSDKQIVSTLVRLAGSERALELGIGTGRIALPLAKQGVEVHGIDASQAMVEKLRAKSGGNNVPVTIGDFADFRVDGHFGLIFVVFNTFFALPTQEEQVHCFCHVAQHLAPDGVFLIEAFVPDLTRFVRGQNMSAISVETDQVALDLTHHDPASQRIRTQHLLIDEAGIRLYPVQLRYTWPSELDLMAQIAGLRLRARWNDWNESPFTSASANHISIYEHDPDRVQ